MSQMHIDDILKAVPCYREALVSMKERILADAVMIGEIPSPTFGERRLVEFICNRFTEEALDTISVDEAENATAILEGRTGKTNILLAAHTDRVWNASIDHAITVSSRTLTGPGIADNALGVAALTTLPSLLNALDIQLDSNIILLGASRSMGRGDLAGLRFFTENSKRKMAAGVCLEGVQLGRLSYSSLGMNRCEIQVATPEQHHWQSWSLSGAVSSLSRIIQQILAIETPQEPKTSIILGSVQSGTSYNVPPTSAVLRFEVRSEEPGMVKRIREEIEEILAQAIAENRIEATLEVIARRQPGTIGFSHPYVRQTRQIMKALDIEPQVAPSTSELSVLLQNGIPSLTLGLTEGDKKHRLDETVRIEPIFSGLAQVIATLQTIDRLVNHEQN
jgi:acetylornithine deacetylase/succinyl-diaminopimelate desuccinylase-like protein